MAKSGPQIDQFTIRQNECLEYNHTEFNNGLIIQL